MQLGLFGTVGILLVVLFVSALVLFKRGQNAGLRNGVSVGGSNSKSNNGKPTFLIVGPCNSGKTLLTYTLRFLAANEEVSGTETTHNTQELDVPLTVTSQAPLELINYNLPTLGLTTRNLTLSISRATYQLENYIKGNKNLKGVIFVMDSTDNGEKLVDTVEFLFEVLNYVEKYHNGVDILIACNKKDLFAARPANKVEEQLQIKLKELTVRKRKSVATKTSSHGSTGGPASSGKSRGGRQLVAASTNSDDSQELYAEHLMSSAFTFQDLDGSFDSISGSVLRNEITNWIEWIGERL
ncbi:hypothetical protein ACO0RG_000877 [Hanseniaspora osmophila]